MPAISAKPDYAGKSKYKSASKTTVKLTDLLKIDPKKEQSQEGQETNVIADEPFTPEQLHEVWMLFADQRKSLAAEHQLLTQPYTLEESKIIVQLLHPVQETMLNNLKSEIVAFLREKLKNNTITLSGELVITDDKKVIYTNREKFEYLAEKNPLLNELKERLGLDTDF